MSLSSSSSTTQSNTINLPYSLSDSSSSSSTSTTNKFIQQQQHQQQQQQQQQYQQLDYHEHSTPHSKTLTNVLLNSISCDNQFRQYKNTIGSSSSLSSSSSSVYELKGRDMESGNNFSSGYSDGGYGGNDCTLKLSGLNAIDLQNTKLSGDILKKNPNFEFNKSDLLKIVSHLEGELQARDVVIAALKSEKVKYLINGAHTAIYKPIGQNDPTAALFRDTIACYGNVASNQASTDVAQTENDIRILVDQQMDLFEQSLMQQRHTQLKMISVLRESDEQYQHMVTELNDEKERRPPEHDMVQCDEITYALGKERTLLKQQLQNERILRNKSDRDLKRVREVLHGEKSRQKQIVLLLLAERKKIIMKYIEERKRSEDLSQILSEEKQRVDTIAEGLEEESKKSLRMEAEMEKQLQQFEIERKTFKSTILNDEKRIKEQENEIAQLRTENEMLKNKQTRNIVSQSQKSGFNIRSNAIVSDSIDDPTTNSPMMSSVAKVVQPTATATSVPVSGPTTGIARSISPGHCLRQIPSSSPSPPMTCTAATSLSPLPTDIFNTTKVMPRKIPPAIVPSAISNISGGSGGVLGHLNSVIDSSGNCATQILNNTSMILKNTLGNSTASSHSTKKSPQLIANNISQQTPTTTTVGATSSNMLTTSTSAISTLPNDRGCPPPIPPNKPIIPPKRDGSITRLNSILGNTSSHVISNNSSTTSKDLLLQNNGLISSGVVNSNNTSGSCGIREILSDTIQ